MPTPDASQFTQLKKYSAINTGDKGQVQQKTITHLYQPVPSVTHPLDFLASFTNKYTSGNNHVRRSILTGRHTNPKTPGGNINGHTPEIITRRTATFGLVTLGGAVPTLPLGGPYGAIVLRLTGVGASTSVVFRFDTSSLIGFNFASVASYVPLIGTKIQTVAFAADTITITTNGSSGTSDVHTATINISSNDFNFDILSVV